MTKANQIVTALKMILRTDFMMILFVVLMVDLAARASSLPGFNLPWNTCDLPYRTRIWWATKDFLSQAKAPDIVLLGPSTMTCALYGAEAMYTRQPQYELLKHNSYYLQDRLRELGAGENTTFCLANPGQVPSDAYMIAKALLKNNKLPKVVFYGITARDFIDCTFNDPADTDTFKLMSQLGHFPELQLSCRSSIWEKLNYELGQLSFIYGHKQALISEQHHLTQQFLADVDGTQFTPITTPVFIRKQAMKQLPEDFGPHDVDDFYDPNRKKVDNMEEYRARYRNFRPKRFQQQLSFFKGIVEFCRESNIKLYVANMPITKANRDLIPPAVYNLYQSKTSEIVRNAGAEYIDFDNNDFVADDFFDSVHLNDEGGEKMLDHIAQEIARGSTLARKRSQTL